MSREKHHLQAQKQQKQRLNEQAKFKQSQQNNNHRQRRLEKRKLKRQEAKALAKQRLLERQQQIETGVENWDLFNLTPEQQFWLAVGIVIIVASICVPVAAAAAATTSHGVPQFRTSAFNSSAPVLRNPYGFHHDNVTHVPPRHLNECHILSTRINTHTLGDIDIPREKICIRKMEPADAKKLRKATEDYYRHKRDKNIANAFPKLYRDGFDIDDNMFPKTGFRITDNIMEAMQTDAAQKQIEEQPHRVDVLGSDASTTTSQYVVRRDELHQPRLRTSYTNSAAYELQQEALSAILHGKPERLRELIQIGLIMPTLDDQSLLDFAIETQRVAIVNVFCETGCFDLNYLTKFNYISQVNYLHLSVAQKNEQIFNSILSKVPQLIHGRDSNDNTPLQWAVDENNIIYIKALLKQGADVYIDEIKRATPKHKKIFEQFRAEKQQAWWAANYAWIMTAAATIAVVIGGRLAWSWRSGKKQTSSTEPQAASKKRPDRERSDHLSNKEPTEQERLSTMVNRLESLNKYKTELDNTHKKYLEIFEKNKLRAILVSAAIDIQNANHRLDSSNDTVKKFATKIISLVEQIDHKIAPEITNNYTKHYLVYQENLEKYKKQYAVCQRESTQENIDALQKILALLDADNNALRELNSQVETTKEKFTNLIGQFNTARSKVPREEANYPTASHVHNPQTTHTSSAPKAIAPPLVPVTKLAAKEPTAPPPPPPKTRAITKQNSKAPIEKQATTAEFKSQQKIKITNTREALIQMGTRYLTEIAELLQSSNKYDTLIKQRVLYDNLSYYLLKFFDALLELNYLNGHFHQNKTVVNDIRQTLAHLPDVLDLHELINSATYLITTCKSIEFYDAHASSLFGYTFKLQQQQPKINTEYCLDKIKHALLRCGVISKEIGSNKDIIDPKLIQTNIITLKMAFARIGEYCKVLSKLNPSLSKDLSKLPFFNECILLRKAVHHNHSQDKPDVETQKVTELAMRAQEMIEVISKMEVANSESKSKHQIDQGRMILKS